MNGFGKILTCAFVRLATDQVDEVGTTGVAFALTVGNTDAQIKQRYVRTKSPDQMLPRPMTKSGIAAGSGVSVTRAPHWEKTKPLTIVLLVMAVTAGSRWRANLQFSAEAAPFGAVPIARKPQPLRLGRNSDSEIRDHLARIMV